MINKYHDAGATGGANDGSSWANAWTNLQTAIDAAAVSGDDVTLWCCNTTGGSNNTYVAGAIIDDDTKSGSNSYIVNIVGVNPTTKAEDGTIFWVDGNSAIVNCIKIAGVFLKRYRNVGCKRATADGWNVSNATAYYLDFINCRATLNGQDGFGTAAGSGRYNTYRLCYSYSNTRYQFSFVGANTFAFGCVASGGTQGFRINVGTLLNQCISYSTGYGIVAIGENNRVISCVIASCTTSGIYHTNYDMAVSGCDIVSCLVGITMANTAGCKLFASHNRYWNNTNKLSVGASGEYYSDGTDTDEAADPHMSAATGNFMPKATAGLINTVIALPDGVNTDYVHAGLGIGPWLFPAVAKVTNDVLLWGPNGTGYGPGEVVIPSCSSRSVSSTSGESESSQSSRSDSSISKTSVSDSSRSDSSRSNFSASSDSSSFMITAGSDSIQAQITENIKAALKTITIANGYNYDIAAVEQARKLMEINNRWPYILLLENEPQKDDEGLVIRELEYVVWFFSKQDDRVIADPSNPALDIDTEIAYYNRNAIADITKALNVDIYRGTVDGTTHARAEITEVIPGTHDLFVDETAVLFGTWCTVKVVTNIDATNPYQLRQGV